MREIFLKLIRIAKERKLAKHTVFEEVPYHVVSPYKSIHQVLVLLRGTHRHILVFVVRRQGHTSIKDKEVYYMLLTRARV
jgi:hypothetical protein